MKKPLFGAFFVQTVRFEPFSERTIFAPNGSQHPNMALIYMKINFFKENQYIQCWELSGGVGRCRDVGMLGTHFCYLPIPQTLKIQREKQAMFLNIIFAFAGAVLALISVLEYIPKRHEQWKFVRLVRDKGVKLGVSIVCIVTMFAMQVLIEYDNRIEQAKKDLTFQKSINEKDSLRLKDMERFYLRDSINQHQIFVKDSINQVLHLAQFNSKLEELTSPITDLTFTWTPSGYIIGYRVNKKVEEIRLRIRRKGQPEHLFLSTGLPHEVGYHSFQLGQLLYEVNDYYHVNLETKNPYYSLPTFDLFRFGSSNKDGSGNAPENKPRKGAPTIGQIRSNSDLVTGLPTT